ncbi:hypothetical protein D6779_07660 [Candidatus Parcubacteria bacterium]|nr:MAG: hypothetical protein D6779_07660 [Candidatus Parcubacteria bacterium]
MRNIRATAGLTILEIIVAMGIFAIIVAVIGIFGIDVGKLGLFISDKLQSQQDLFYVFQRITTEIRSMGPSDAGAYPIVSAASSSLVFYSDVDKDGSFERVRYFLATSTLERGIIEATGTPASYPSSTEVIAPAIEQVVQNGEDVFQYYDANYTGSEDPMAYPIDVAKVRLIRVTVSVDVREGAPKPTRFSRLIDIRNLRSN